MKAIRASFVVALAGCASGPPPVQISLVPAEEAAFLDQIKKGLKDPYSAHFEGLRAARDSAGTTHVCVYVNAKNSFGGYTGRQLYYVTRLQGSEPMVFGNIDGLSAGMLCGSRGIMPA